MDILVLKLKGLSKPLTDDARREEVDTNAALLAFINDGTVCFGSLSSISAFGYGCTKRCEMEHIQS
jgi:hypothetical protein